MSSRTWSISDNRIVGAISEKPGSLYRRVQAHVPGAGEYSSGECKLHHGLAARYRQASARVRIVGAKAPRRPST
jgi:hypothetical protein